MEDEFMSSEGKSILEVRSLKKTFPKSGFSLDEVSFSLPYGSIMGFVGENGAGKTTTIGCILGTLKKDYKIIWKRNKWR